MKHKLLLILLTFISASVFGQAWQDGANGVQFRYVGDKREIRQLIKSPQPPYGVTDSLAKLEAFINKKDFLSTGLIDHAALSATIGGTTFNISAGHGVVANFDNHFYPSIKRVNITAKTGITPQFLTTAITSYVAIDSNDNVVQSASPFTDVQSRDLIILGAIVHSNLTNINAVNNIAKPVISNTNQLHDLYEAVGALNTAGNKYTANGSNLNIDKSAGNLFKLGVNFINDWKSPSKLTIALQTAATFRYRTQTGTEFADRTTIDPGFYDVAGTRTAIPGSLNQFTIQRITLFQSGLTRIQYGQNVYANKSEAMAAVSTESFTTETNIAENGIFRAYLVVRANATALNDLAQAEFIEVGKFGSPIGNAGGAVTSANIIAALGYTPENLANKTTNLTSPDNTKYPSTLAVSTGLGLKLDLTGGNLTGLLNSTNSINSTTGNYIGVAVGSPNSAAISVAGLEISNSSFSQNIYGSSSTPTMSSTVRLPKDSSGTVALIGNNGRFTLPVTTLGGLGVIYKGVSRFIHDYQPSGGNGANIFIGKNSGNYTMTASVPDSASNNVGVGDNTLNKLGHGYVNTAVGSGAMKEARHANGEVAVGAFALTNDQDGIHNVAIGYSALSSTTGNQSFTNGLENTAIGFFAGGQNTIGRQNIFIGANAGSAVGSKVDAINSMALGYNVQIAADNTYYYGNGSVQNHVFAGDQTWYGTRTTGITGSTKIVLSQSPSFSGTISAENLTLGGKLIVGPGVFNTGESALFTTPTLGTVLAVKDGSTNNFTLTRENGSGIFTVPSGTENVNFAANISAVTYTGGATLTGISTAPTPTAGDNSTKIATTAFVQNALNGGGATPSISVTGAGTGATININGNNVDGVITITAGTSPSAMQIQVTFSGGFSYPTQVTPVVSPFSSPASTLGYYLSALGNNTFTISQNAAATGGGTYNYTYHAGGF